jgi:hypothetical protein
VYILRRGCAPLLRSGVSAGHKCGGTTWARLRQASSLQAKFFDADRKQVAVFSRSSSLATTPTSFQNQFYKDLAEKSTSSEARWERAVDIMILVIFNIDCSGR